MSKYRPNDRRSTINIFKYLLLNRQTKIACQLRKRRGEVQAWCPDSSKSGLAVLRQGRTAFWAVSCGANPAGYSWPSQGVIMELPEKPGRFSRPGFEVSLNISTFVEIEGNFSSLCEGALPMEGEDTFLERDMRYGTHISLLFFCLGQHLVGPGRNVFSGPCLPNWKAWKISTPKSQFGPGVENFFYFTPL
jgi:hypothetical protein